MKLNSILNESTVNIFHITTTKAYPRIATEGLKIGKEPRFGKVGRGIYLVYLDGDVESRALTFAEYIGVDEPILLRVNADNATFLMDEDALSNDDAIAHLESLMNDPKRKTDPIYNHFPEGSVEELIRLLGDFGGEEIDRQICVELIDKYQIKPYPELKTEMGHYSFDTVRCVQPQIPVLGAWKWNENLEAHKL